MTLEIVVYNIESALKAQEGGADRVELCDNPGEGGTTPSFGMIEAVRQNVNLDVFVMIRPRGGDFHYSNYEFHCMKRDIDQCQKLSADGVVFGILNTDGTIDKKRCKELIDRARPMKVTCHRAFDMTAALARKANGRIAIMPGSGVNENAVEKIVGETGVSEIHFSATSFRESAMQYRNLTIAGMGSDEGSEFKYRTVDPERVRAVRKLAEKAQRK
jgi:copper homeostasis protein